MINMKKNYFILTFLFVALMSTAQSYKFGIVNISDYNFKIVAIPDFTSNGNTDASDVGFTLVLPAGNADAVNPVGLLTGRAWDISPFDAAFLTSLDLGDGTKDVFQFNLPPGQSIVSHTAGDYIDLVSFNITNSPETGDMYLMSNSDPIAVGASGVLDAFYNSNIDGTTTQDYFGGFETGLESFSFATLSVTNEDKINYNVSLFPNPAKTVVNIKSDSEILKIECYDLLGKMVLNTASNQNRIDVSEFQSGMYLIKVYTSNGKFIGRLIKD